MRVRMWVVAGATLLAAEPARAGEWRFGGGGLLGLPRGELQGEIGAGGGVHGQALYAGRGALGLRLDGSFFLYGSETVRIPLAPPLTRLTREIRTDNWVAGLTAGPQVAAPRGRVRPYANAFAGVSYYSTTSELSEPDPFGPRLTSTNFDDTAFCYGAGAGLLLRLGGGHAALDLGARWVHDSRVSYLAKGDAAPRRSEGDRLELRLGVASVPRR